MFVKYRMRLLVIILVSIPVYEKRVYYSTSKNILFLHSCQSKQKVLPFHNLFLTPQNFRLATCLVLIQPNRLIAIVSVHLDLCKNFQNVSRGQETKVKK